MVGGLIGVSENIDFRGRRGAAKMTMPFIATMGAVKKTMDYRDDKDDVRHDRQANGRPKDASLVGAMTLFRALCPPGVFLMMGRQFVGAFSDFLNNSVAASSTHWAQVRRFSERISRHLSEPAVAAKPSRKT